jgi:hypothetical protein
LEPRKQHAIDALAEMISEEGDQPMRGRRIGADGVGRAAPVAGKMILPAKRCCGRWVMV